MSVEMCDGLPIPPDHPRFVRHDGEWKFQCERGEFPKVSELHNRMMVPFYEDSIDDCRNCARCYWLDSAFSAPRRIATEPDKIQCEDYAELCRVWRK